MRYNIFLPINPKNYCPQLLNRLSDVYKHAASDNLNVVIMGPRDHIEINAIEEILSKFDSDINIYKINSFGFNYAYGVNYAVKEGLKKGLLNHENLILMIDSWTLLSIITLEINVRKFDLDVNFAYVNVMKDVLEATEPIDYHAEQLVMLASTRILRTKRDTESPKMVTPIPVLKIKHFIDMNGLEESYFTDYARAALIDKINKSGYLQQIEATPWALSVTASNIYSNQQYNKDKLISKQLMDNIPKKFFIPNNFKKGDFGNPQKISNIILTNNIYEWQNTTNVINITQSNDEIEKILKKDILPKKIEDCGIALLLDNDLRSLFEGTKNIKKIYLKYNKPITLIVSNISKTPINRLKNFMVKEIVNAQTLNVNKFDISEKYDFIYSSNTCTLLSMFKDKKIETLEEDFTIDPYYSYDNNIFTNEKFPNNFITISCSSRKKLNKKFIQTYKDAVKNLLKRNIDIISIKMTNEDEIVELRELSNYFTNYHEKVISDWDLMTYLTHNAKLTILHMHTDLVWFSKMLHTDALVISNSKNFLTDYTSQNVKSVHYTDKNINSEMITYVVERM